MAHPAQQNYCSAIKMKFPDFFRGKLVLDIGSLDINGNNQTLFSNSLYLGVDIAPGKNVDLLAKGHELGFPDNSFDTIVSTECFEHDMHYERTLKNICRMLKPGGMFVFTCATTGRAEHGTRSTTPQDAPFLQDLQGWSDYYKNLTEADIRNAIDIESTFQNFEFSVNSEACDLYFWGIKRGDSIERTNYSFLVPDGIFQSHNIDLIKALEDSKKEISSRLDVLQTNIDTILNSRSWRYTKFLRSISSILRALFSLKHS